MPKLAIVFPGQGSQYSGMGADLYQEFAAARTVFEAANQAIGYDLAELCFRGSEDELKLTERTQPATLVHSIAAWEVLKEHLDADSVQAMAGLSLGEFSALVASGVLDLKEAVATVRERGAAMQSAVPVGVGAMAAILGLAPDILEETVATLAAEQDGVLDVANYNSPGQIVISGQKEAVEAAIEPLKAAGASRAVMLPVSAPFHCSMLKPAAERLAEVLNGVQVADFRYPVVANVTADYYQGSGQVKELLIRQVTSPVRWEQSIRRLLAEDFDTFIELGPGITLNQFIKRIARDAKAEIALASLDKADDLPKVVELLKERGFYKH